jgi:dolichol-phosphate mannosyltransferase
VSSRPRKVLVAIFAYNEAEKLQRTVLRFCELKDVDLLIMDDGSTDGSIGRLGTGSWTVLRNETNRGAGYSVRRVLLHAREAGYEVACLVAGNDKDRPEDIARIVEPVLAGRAEFVQGSRYAPGGAYGNMPLSRRVATRWIHPLLVFAMTRRWLSDTTNGFRAIRLSILGDPRIDLSQPWLDRYELEPYLLYKVLRLGYRVEVVPVTKIYPEHSQGYTKVRAFSGWWSILRPYVLIALRLKR